MSNLRNKIIRLAHENPELRKELLPLLKEAGAHRKTSTKTASAQRVVREINSLIEKQIGPDGTAKDVMTEKRVSMWFRSQLEVNVYDKSNGKTVIEFEGQLYRSPKDVAAAIIKTWKSRGDLTIL